MNKKILALIISACIILCACGTSLADKADYSKTPFDIRNGIGYGSTMADVKSTEDSNNNVEFVDQDGEMLSYKGQIAGYKDSQEFYFFSDGKLSSFCFRVGAASDGSQKYDDVMNGLVGEYGEPDMLNQQYSETFHPLFVHKNDTYEKYSQWLVEYSDCDVVITLYTDDASGSDCCFLKYDLYTHSEMEQLVAEILNPA